MPPNLQRFLPIILIAFVLLFILPAVFRKSTSKGPSSSTLSTETIAAMTLVDRDEKLFIAGHKDYTSHVADLLGLSPALGQDLSDGVGVNLDVSTDGKTYYAQVTSTVLGMVRSRTGAKEIANGCLVIKSGSGVACPTKPAAKTTASTTASTSTTTTTTTG
ncbi:MAG TPA: hypothetical protein VG265_16495 [Gaiellaceae bacterium]|nr:hypothetical protein [Gaiellaceae bacterium]